MRHVLDFTPRDLRNDFSQVVPTSTLREHVASRHMGMSHDPVRWSPAAIRTTARHVLFTENCLETTQQYHSIATKEKPSATGVVEGYAYDSQSLIVMSTTTTCEQRTGIGPSAFGVRC